MKIITTVTLLLFYMSNIFAQAYGIRDTMYLNDDKMRPALIVNLEADDMKDFKRYVKKYYKNEFGIKMHSSKLEIDAKEFVIPKISPKELDCFIDLIPINTNDMSFVIMLRFGYDYYISKEAYPEEYASFRIIVKEFAQKYLRDYYSEKLEEHQKALKKAQKTNKKLLKENRKLTKRTAKNERKIRKYQRKINKKPEEMQKYQSKITEKESKNKENRATVISNNKTVKILQEEMMIHNSEVSKIQTKMNRIN